jgi:hypothetical protein
MTHGNPREHIRSCHILAQARFAPHWIPPGGFQKPSMVRVSRSRFGGLLAFLARGTAIPFASAFGAVMRQTAEAVSQSLVGSRTGTGGSGQTSLKMSTGDGDGVAEDVAVLCDRVIIGLRQSAGHKDGGQRNTDGAGLAKSQAGSEPRPPSERGGLK